VVDANCKRSRLSISDKLGVVPATEVPKFGVAEVLRTLFRDLERAEQEISKGQRNPLAISAELAFTVTAGREGGGGLSIGW
jgi:hypothetical protein